MQQTNQSQSARNALNALERKPKGGLILRGCPILEGCPILKTRIGQRIGQPQSL